jgi:hypothetical protein
MPPKTDPPRDDSPPPAVESWYVGRRGFGVAALVLACLSTGVVVLMLAADEIDSAGSAIFTASQGLLAVTFASQALHELRSRVTADGDGVHRQAALRRHTHRWEEIAEVRRAGVLWGEPYLELVRHDGGTVALPKSARYLHVLDRWHTDATGPSAVESHTEQ